mmetsp:Transcript_35687/g.73363  ORF Transcript_35687/g.73363 Transcript_35687/m.73363 type:complete len:256 (+) Transcript_35687:700-1467(+)
MKNYYNFFLKNKLFKNNDVILLCITDDSQLSFFFSKSYKVIVFGETEKTTIPSIFEKNIQIIDKNFLFTNLPRFDFFISFDNSFLDDKFVLKIMKNPKSVKGVFFLNKNTIRPSVLNFRKSASGARIWLYITFFFNVSDKSKLRLNGMEPLYFNSIQFIPRKKSPNLNIVKWDQLLRLFFSKKNKTISQFQKGAIFLLYCTFKKKKKIGFKIEKRFNILGRDLFQRGLDENGISVIKGDSIDLKEYLFFLNTFGY